MIHNDPPRIPHNHNFRRPAESSETSTPDTNPTFPRSGWADKSSLSSSLRDAIVKMRYDYSDYFNWRRPQQPPVSVNPPTAMPMYGMPNPGPGRDEVGPNPRTPGAMPMYGMPNPGPGRDEVGPQPWTPGPMPMYGMPNPGPGRDEIGPQPWTPGPMPMYGMPNPGNGGGSSPFTPPNAMPMYGMPNP